MENTQVLNYIQTKLKAPKNQHNDFGKYNYRSFEDILEGLKPLLVETKASLIVSDEIIQIGDRYYVKATARLFGEDGQQIAQASAYARESESKKGMDVSQITGSASSYSRKYCAGGLFLIEDTQDSDALPKSEDGGNGDQPKKKKETATKPIESTPLAITDAQGKKLTELLDKIEDWDTATRGRFKDYLTKREDVATTKIKLTKGGDMTVPTKTAMDVILKNFTQYTGDFIDHEIALSQEG